MNPSSAGRVDVVGGWRLGDGRGGTLEKRTGAAGLLDRGVGRGGHAHGYNRVRSTTVVAL